MTTPRTLRPSEALALHRDEVRAVIARYPVSNPQIFGSAARGEDRVGSDLDILVEHDGKVSFFDLARLELELEHLLGSPIEVRTPDGLAADVRARVADDLQPI